MNSTFFDHKKGITYELATTTNNSFFICLQEISEQHGRKNVPFIKLF
jgi:hypothetical protein